MKMLHTVLKLGQNLWIADSFSIVVIQVESLTRHNFPMQNLSNQELILSIDSLDFTIYFLNIIVSKYFSLSLSYLHESNVRMS